MTTDTATPPGRYDPAACSPRVSALAPQDPARGPHRPRPQRLATDDRRALLKRRTRAFLAHRTLCALVLLGCDALALSVGVLVAQRAAAPAAVGLPSLVFVAFWMLGTAFGRVPRRAAAGEFRGAVRLAAFASASAALTVVCLEWAGASPLDLGGAGVVGMVSGLFVAVSGVLVLRGAARWALTETGVLSEPAAVYGRQGYAEAVCDRLAGEPALGIAPAAVEAVEDDQFVLGGPFPPGPPEAFVGVMAESGLDHDQAGQLLDWMVSVYPTVLVLPDLRSVPPLCVRYDEVGGTFAMRVGSSLASPFTRAAKRLVEVAVVVATAPVWAPVCALVAGVIWLEDRASPLFSQPRVGQDGRVFEVYKFRTMRPNAEEVLLRELDRDPALRKEWEGSFKLRRDPRVTKVGAFLRQSSLDEVPQVLNVLLGEMSIVGPRPLPAYHYDELPAAVRALREQVPPGITGLWQVSGRSEAGTEGMARWDPYYVRNWSLWLDAEIVLRTVGAVLRSRGAY